MQTLKPFLMLACVAFAVGFAGYLAVARLTAASAEALEPNAVQAPISDPAPESDDLADLRAA